MNFGAYRDASGWAPTFFRLLWLIFKDIPKNDWDVQRTSHTRPPFGFTGTYGLVTIQVEKINRRERKGCRENWLNSRQLAG